jgi:hypothetical protein
MLSMLSRLIAASAPFTGLPFFVATRSMIFAGFGANQLSAVAGHETGQKPVANPFMVSKENGCANPVPWKTPRNFANRLSWRHA